MFVDGGSPLRMFALLRALSFQVEFLDTGAQASGVGVTEPLPAAVALCVTLRTAGAGKRFRGRIYVPGWSEAQNDANGLTASTASTAAVAFINAINTGLTPSNLALGVLSRPAFASITTKETTDNLGNRWFDR